jgi:hypothetical protein
MSGWSAGSECVGQQEVSVLVSTVCDRLRLHPTMWAVSPACSNPQTIHTDVQGPSPSRGGACVLSAGLSPCVLPVQALAQTCLAFLCQRQVRPTFHRAAQRYLHALLAYMCIPRAELRVTYA